MPEIAVALSFAICMRPAINAGKIRQNCIGLSACHTDGHSPTALRKCLRAIQLIITQNNILDFIVVFYGFLLQTFIEKAEGDVSEPLLQVVDQEQMLGIRTL